MTDSVDATAGHGYSLPITGERTVPGIRHENYWFRRHEVVYRWLLDHAHNARVLDAGCGEGYGARMLATVAARVTAVDYDPLSVAHVRNTYPEVTTVRGNLVQLPFADASFDVIVSLQTIEHLWNQPAFVAECARLVAPDGLVIISTPNRATFPPGNVCHFRELAPEELRDLLSTGLRVDNMFGLRHGERLRQWEKRHGSLPHAQIATDPDRWSPDLTELVGSVRADDFELHPDDLETTLDLIATCRCAPADAT